MPPKLDRGPLSPLDLVRAIRAANHCHPALSGVRRPTLRLPQDENEVPPLGHALGHFLSHQGLSVLLHGSRTPLQATALSTCALEGWGGGEGQWPL